MRTAVYLAILSSILAVIFAAQRLTEGGVDYHFVAFLLFIPAGIAPYLYGARLANRHHTDNPERFGKFTGTSNLSIVRALFRASQAGDRIATWSLVVMFAAPFLFGLLLFAPEIGGR